MEMDLKTEVCVVGGGPGGAFASAYLNKFGIKHVLIEAEHFPRNKPCADGISSLVMKRVKEVLPEAYQNLKTSVQLHPLKGINFYPPSNKSYKYTYRKLEEYEEFPVVHVKREAFDAHLLKAVSNQEHSDVYQGVRATDIQQKEDHAVVITNKGEVRCKMVIVASGCKGSFAAKYTNNKHEKNHFALGVRAYYRNVEMSDDSYSELYLDKKIFPGALYITALGDNLYNVNCVLTLKSLQEKEGALRDVFENVLKTHPVLSKNFSNATLEGKIDGHGLLLGTKDRSLSRERTLFVGDAGGLIDLISANGIPQAMESAKIAAEVAVEAIKENQYSAKDLRRYDRLVYAKLKGSFRGGRAINVVFSNTVLSRIYFSLANVLLSKVFLDFYMYLSFYMGNPFKKRKQSSSTEISKIS